MNPQDQFSPQQPQVPAQPVAPGPVVIGPTQAQQPTPIQSQPMGQPLFAPDTQAPVMPTMGTQQPFGAQPQPMQHPMGAKNNKKLFIIAGVVVLVLVVGGVVALSGGKEKTSTSTTPSTTTPTSSVSATTDTANKEEPAATAVTTPINKVLIGDLGLTITATKMTRNFQQKDFASANPDQEAIVLNITAASNEGYNLVVSATSFRLVTPDGKEYRTASVLRDFELKAAGLTPWPGGSAKKGIPITGDMAFGVPKNATSLILRYKQDEVKVLGANARTIPAKNIDIPLLP